MFERLFPYQKIGAEFLAKKSLALLADEMGLGKTPQAIVAADLVKAKSVCVICPAIGRINWRREFENFSARKWTEKDLVISSFESAHKIPQDLEFDVLIIDEAHYLKSTEAKRTALIYGKEGLVRRAKRVWALTGTPAPNNASELWTMLFTFGVTKLSFDQFVERYCTYYNSSYGRMITGNNPFSLPELQGLLAQVMLRRKKGDVMKQLPPLSYAHVLVPRGEVDLEQYDSFVQYVDRPDELKRILEHEKNMVDYIYEKQGDSANALRALEALANSVSTLRRYTALQKVNPVCDVLADELMNNAYEKVVIFAVHRDVIEGTRRRLEKFGALTLYGGQDDRKKQRNIDAFQKDPNKRVIICNIQAAGTSVTLTAAHNIVFMEQDWTPGNNAQATMRVHRIGQNNPVFVRVFGLAESIDEHVSKSLKRKMNELTRLFDMPSEEKINGVTLTQSNHDEKTSSLRIDKNLTEETDIEEIGELLK